MDYLKHPHAKAFSRDVLEDPYQLDGHAKMVAAKRLLLSGGGLLAQREAALETVLGYFQQEKHVATDNSLIPGTTPPIVGSRGFLQREIDRLEAAMADEKFETYHWNELFAARQALVWATEPTGFASPLDTLERKKLGWPTAHSPAMPPLPNGEV